MSMCIDTQIHRCTHTDILLCSLEKNSAPSDLYSRIRVNWMCHVKNNTPKEAKVRTTQCTQSEGLRGGRGRGGGGGAYWKLKLINIPLYYEDLDG